MLQANLECTPCLADCLSGLNTVSVPRSTLWSNWKEKAADSRWDGSTSAAWVIIFHWELEKKKKKSSCIHKEKLPPDPLPNANVIAPAAEALFSPPTMRRLSVMNMNLNTVSGVWGAVHRDANSTTAVYSSAVFRLVGQVGPENKEAQTHTCTVNEHKWILFTLYGRSIESRLNNQRVRMPGYESASAPSYQSACFSERKKESLFVTLEKKQGL